MASKTITISVDRSLLELLARATMNKLLKAFTRTKHLKPSDFKTTPLNRCLSTMDLAALGVSSTIGTGIYVLTGEVTRLKAGPSVILSFLIAALASMLCALCYAEFGARFPKAGSAYIYSYVTIGELCAFTIGWNLILEYVVGTAATARVWGSFCDALFNNRIQEFVAKTIGTIHAPLLAKYPDFLAFFAVVAVVAVVALGVKQSVVFNWFFLILNVVVILFVTIAGLCFADFSNWSDFFPFGFEGTMAGAAILFYSFVGFDVVASCGEEAQTPTKSIPNAIIGCLVFSFFAYLGVAAALSLMLPYNELTEYSSIATAFDKRGFPAGKYIVAAGATFALLSGIAGQLFPLPRIMYSMATDRVIFSFLGRINKRTETPLVACIIGGIVTGLLTLLLDLISLVEMLSIGTLLAYTIVALCVLLLRYRPGDAGIQIDRSEGSDEEVEPDDDIEITVEENASKNSKVGDDNKSPQKTNKQENGDQLDPISNQNVTPTLNPWTQFYHRVIGWQRTEPTQETYSTVKVAAFVFVVLSIILLGCLIYGLNSFTWMHPSFSAIGVFLVVAILFVVQIIASQPQSKSELPFKVRFVPLVPLLSVFMNIYLILMLSHYTWIRFSVWMVIGMLIYLLYGVKHSKQNPDFTGNIREEVEYTKLNEEGDEEATKSKLLD